jgi:hypothetical protein
VFYKRINSSNIEIHKTGAITCNTMGSGKTFVGAFLLPWWEEVRWRGIK